MLVNKAFIELLVPRHKIEYKLVNSLDVAERGGQYVQQCPLSSCLGLGAALRMSSTLRIISAASEAWTRTCLLTLKLSVMPSSDIQPISPSY